jgi:ketosteroid isomerase-like protein
MHAARIRCRFAPWLAALAVAIVMALGACARTPPEQALRESLAGLFEAVEARDAAALRAYLAEDFIGPDGLDREGARRMAAMYLMRHDGVGVTTGPLDLQLHGEHAQVGFSAVLAGRTSAGFLPDSARGWQVDTGWRLVDGTWRMTSADWSPLVR